MIDPFWGNKLLWVSTICTLNIVFWMKILARAKQQRDMNQRIWNVFFLLKSILMLSLYTFSCKHFVVVVFSSSHSCLTWMCMRPKYEKLCTLHEKNGKIYIVFCYFTKDKDRMDRNFECRVINYAKLSHRLRVVNALAMQKMKCQQPFNM